MQGESRKLELWQAALRAYRARAWDEAEVKLLDLQRTSAPCGLYKMYLKRIEQMRREPPPPDWDGVSVFDEK